MPMKVNAFSGGQFCADIMFFKVFKLALIMPRLSPRSSPRSSPSSMRAFLSSSEFHSNPNMLITSLSLSVR